MRICGLEFTSDTLHRIRQTLSGTPLISKRSLARRVCEWMDWTALSGRPKEAVCRKALTILDGQGVIELAPSCRVRRVANPMKVKPHCLTLDMTCDLSELGDIELKMITSASSKAAGIWKALMDTHHYLGSGPLCGAQIRYLVQSSRYGYIGALSFSSAAWALKERDKFIGWTEPARRSNLQRVICNSRFLIVPGVRVANLASHVLGQCTRRIAGDWAERYGVEPVLLETFVDPARFLGTSYLAANWILAGRTSGRRAAERQQGAGPKEIWLYPLRKDFAQILCTAPAIGLCERPRLREPADWVEEELGSVEFYDPRLSRRFFDIVRDFYSQPQAAIPQACGSQSRVKGAYRFFGNRRVSMDSVLCAHIESSVERIKGHEVVLAVQDTSSLDYTTHLATEQLGPINTTKDQTVGLLLHDTMAFTTDGTPLGLLNVQCWARDRKDTGKKHRRAQLPIEQKESVKWLNSYRAVSRVQELCPNTTLVSVGDREADIYELFLEAAGNPCGPKLLVRSERTRRRAAETGNLWEQMQAQPVAGIQVIHIPRKGCQLARDAKLEVRHGQVELKAPQGKGYPSVKVWIVYAKEIDTPQAVSPLEWMLLTSVAVDNFEQACERLNWYAKRWGIEVYHRTLKSGCRIEDRRLETARSLKACLAIDMVVAWRIYHLTKLSRQVPDAACTIFFEEAEWKALYAYSHKELPDKEPTLGQVTGMVAALGGFMGRKGDGKPGTTVLWRGLQRLKDIAATYLALLPYLRAP